MAATAGIYVGNKATSIEAVHNVIMDILQVEQSDHIKALAFEALAQSTKITADINNCTFHVAAEPEEDEESK